MAEHVNVYVDPITAQPSLRECEYHQGKQEAWSQVRVICIYLWLLVHGALFGSPHLAEQPS